MVNPAFKLKHLIPIRVFYTLSEHPIPFDYLYKL